MFKKVYIKVLIVNIRWNSSEVTLYFSLIKKHYYSLTLKILKPNNLND